jgi:antitoxin MazE
MKIKLIQIGNSKAIRLPQSLIEQLKLQDEVILEATNDALIIRPTSKVRDSWAKSFDEMAKQQDDKLLDDYLPSTWEQEKWEWK